MIDTGQEQGPVIGDGLRLVKKPEDIAIRSEDGISVYKSPLIAVPELGLKGLGFSIVEYSEEDIQLDIDKELKGLAINKNGEIETAPLRDMLRDGYGLVDVGSYADQDIDGLTAEFWSAKHPEVKATTILSNPGSVDVGSPDFALDGGMSSEWDFSGAESDKNLKFVVKQDAESIMDLRLRLKAKPISTKVEGGES